MDEKIDVGAFLFTHLLFKRVTCVFQHICRIFGFFFFVSFLTYLCFNKLECIRYQKICKSSSVPFGTILFSLSISDAMKNTFEEQLVVEIFLEGKRGEVAVVNLYLTQLKGRIPSFFFPLVKGLITPLRRSHITRYSSSRS